MDIWASVFVFAGGLGIFLLGMKLISGNLQAAATQSITKTLGKISDSKLGGVGIGVGASFVLQSSTATTVILLGMVNAGLVSLYQSALIIMGANIGTTFTVLVFSFGYLPLSEILSLAALAGVLVVIAAKKEKTTLIGWIISGFGMIFIGLNMMSSGVDFLKDSPTLTRLLLSLDNVVLLVIVGMLVSGITQSSNATTGIVITLAEAGLLPITAAFAIIMGSNVGTCITAMLATLGANVNTKRAATIHLLFNSIGVLLFLPLLVVGQSYINRKLPVFTPAAWVAYFHIAFNVVTTLVLLPFVKMMTNFAIKLVPEKNINKIEKI